MTVTRAKVERRQVERRFWRRFWDNLQEFWAWVDERQIDVHVVSAAILYGTYKLVWWAIGFAGVYATKMSGADIALIIAAVTAPYAAVQTAAIGFVFRAREKSFVNHPPQIIIQQPTTTQTVTTTQ